MFDEVRRIYAQSLKPWDRRSNILFFRVIAAPIVSVCARMGLTPNQVTLGSLIPMFAGLGCWLCIPDESGLYWGLLGIELAYILDCVDGQLARFTGRSSSIGAELDFLMDEVKALLLVCAAWIRLHQSGDGDALLMGALTLLVLAVAFALTRFVRHPIYVEATGTAQIKHGSPPPPRRGPLGLVERFFRLVAFYPESLPLAIALGWALSRTSHEAFTVFLFAYLAVHLLYVAKTGLTLVWKLGFQIASGRSEEGPS